MENKKLSLQSFSEDEFGKKLDRCLTDTLIKGGKFSSFFFCYYITYTHTIQCSIFHVMVFVVKMYPLNFLSFILYC